MPSINWKRVCIINKYLSLKKKSQKLQYIAHAERRLPHQQPDYIIPAHFHYKILPLTGKGQQMNKNVAKSGQHPVTIGITQVQPRENTSLSVIPWTPWSRCYRDTAGAVTRKYDSVSDVGTLRLRPHMQYWRLPRHFGAIGVCSCYRCKCSILKQRLKEKWHRGT